MSRNQLRKGPPPLESGRTTDPVVAAVFVLIMIFVGLPLLIALVSEVPMLGWPMFIGGGCAFAAVRFKLVPVPAEHRFALLGGLAVTCVGGGIGLMAHATNF